MNNRLCNATYQKSFTNRNATKSCHVTNLYTVLNLTSPVRNKKLLTT